MKRGLLRRVLDWIWKLIGAMDRRIKILIPVVTRVVQGVKLAVENEEVLTALELAKFIIPGKVDDIIIARVVQLVKKYIPKIALQLGVVNSLVEVEGEQERINAVMKALKVSTKDMKSDYWHELAAQILKALGDGKITLGEAGVLVEFHYKNGIKKQ